MICILTKKQTNDNTEKLQELCHVSSHLWLMFISEESVNLTDAVSFNNGISWEGLSNVKAK